MRSPGGLPHLVCAQYDAANFRAEWLEENYISIVKRVLEEKPHFASGARGEMQASLSPLLQSPRKRQRQTASSATNREVVLYTVSQLHAGMAVPSDDACALHVHVLHVPSEPRWVKIVNKKIKQEENVQVVSVLLGDSTAVISLQIWREAAMHFGSVLSSVNSTSDDSVPPLVRIERFFAKAAGSKCLTTNRQLAASDKMVVSKVSLSMQDRAPSMQSDLDRSLLIADFILLQDAAPFSTNIVGRTSKCGDVIKTQSGVLRPFLVIDAAGNYVNCVAFGRHAEDERLEDNCEVALYFTHARAGLDGKNGSLWLYDESHLAVLRSAATAPAPRHEVQIKSLS